MEKGTGTNQSSNRCPVPVAVWGVGSIPMRFRHLVQGLSLTYILGPATRRLEKAGLSTLFLYTSHRTGGTSRKEPQ
jgi:hypothetical protein